MRIHKVLFLLITILILGKNCNAQAVTEEVRVKTVYLKAQSGATANASGSTTVSNIYDSGILKALSGGTITASGDLNIVNSASVQIDGQLNVKGHFTNNATASLALAGATVGTVEFNGTSNENIGGTSASVFENLSINNAAGVTLTTNQSVNNALAFSAGIITTGAFRLVLTNTTADGTSGYGTGKYVFGNFRRYVATNLEYALPIGNAINFELASIFIASQTGLTYVDVSFTTANQNPAPGGLTVNGATVSSFLDYGQWTFSPNAGVTAVNYHPTIQSIGHTNLGGTQDNYALISNTSGAWQSLGTQSNSTQQYSSTTVLARREGITAFGNYVIGYMASASYVPVTVTEEVRNKTVYLKSSSGATVNASGSTTVLNNYDSGYLKALSGGTITASGDLNNMNSASIQIDGQLNIKGHFTNNATGSLALPGATVGTVEFNGTSNENIGGTTSSTFESLSINNAAGVTLTTNQTVSSTLAFAAGKITTGAFRLDLTNTTADGTSGYGTGKYVYGNFRRYVSTTLEYAMPIGDATNFELASVFIYSQTGLTYIDASFTTGNQNPAPGGLIVNGSTVTSFLDYGKWTFTPNAGVTSVNYHPSVQSMGHTDLGGNQDNYAVISNLGAGWVSIGTHANTTQQYSSSTVLARRQGLTSFGSYVIGYLPAATYVPFTVTEEVRNKTVYLKSASGATANASGSTTVLNNYDSGTLKALSGGTISASGDLNNMNSASIQIDGQLNVKGHFTNNATGSLALAGATLGTVEFNGTSNENIGGTSASTFEGLSINNAAGVTLTTNQTVSSTLAFSAGKITTGAFRLDLTNTASDGTSGYGTGKYVYGNFRRYVGTTVEYALPIGNATNFELASIFIVSQTGLNYIDVSFTTGNQNPAPGGLLVNGSTVSSFLDYGKWTFTPNAGVSAVNYHPTVQSTGHTDLGGNQDNYALISNIGAGWVSIGTHSNTTQQYSSTTVLTRRQSLTTFGSYVIGYVPAATYIPPTVTEEVRNKTTYLKSASAATANASGTTTVLNNYDSGYLKALSGGTITASGDLNNMNSASVQIDGQLNIKGNFTNNATASLALAGATIGTFEFNGTLNENIGGTSASTFESLSINNAAGVTLTTNQTVSSTLAFSAGKITTGAFRLDLTNTATDGTSGYGTGKYIYGNFRRYVSTNVEYALPIGNATNFELASIFVVSQTGLSYIDVSFTTANQNPAPGGLLINGVTVTGFLDYGKWTFTPNAGVAAVNYHPTIQSIGHTDLGGTQDYYGVISDVGAGWQSLGRWTSSTQQYSSTTVLARTHQLTAFGSYVIGHTTLPIYTPVVVTEELRNKTDYLKAQANATLIASGSTTAFNNYDSGILKINALGVITSEGLLTNANSASIQVDGQLNVKGNWINNATASTALAGATVGTVELNGILAQSIGGSVVTAFESLRMNNTLADISLATNASISNVLTLSNGHLVLGANTLTLQSTATTAGASAGSHVTATSTGTILQNLTGLGTTYTFPVGDGTNYTPIVFKLNTGTLTSASMAFNVTALKHPAAGGATSYIKRYWTGTPIGITGAINYDINYTYVVGDVVGTESLIYPAKYSSAHWTGGPTAANTGTHNLAWSGVTSFSDYSGLDNTASPLPIELLLFNAVKIGDIVNLNWSTASETNNDFFTVERSVDGKTFEAVTRIKGAGNSISLLSYRAIDADPYNGISYYRLKQTDYDGKISYSAVVAVEFRIKDSNIAFFPNPASGQTVHILLQNMEPLDQIQIILRDVHGKEIYSKMFITDNNGACYKEMILSDQLASGVYFLIGTSKSKTFHEKLIIQ